jgi:hypothetical protein
MLGDPRGGSAATAPTGYATSGITVRRSLRLILASSTKTAGRSMAQDQVGNGHQRDQRPISVPMQSRNLFIVAVAAFLGGVGNDDP